MLAADERIREIVRLVERDAFGNLAGGRRRPV